MGGLRLAGRDVKKARARACIQTVEARATRVHGCAGMQKVQRAGENPLTHPLDITYAMFLDSNDNVDLLLVLDLCAVVSAGFGVASKDIAALHSSQQSHRNTDEHCVCVQAQSACAQ